MDIKDADREFIIRNLLATLGFVPQERGTIYILRAVSAILDGAPPYTEIWRNIAHHAGLSLTGLLCIVRKSMQNARQKAPTKWEELLNGIPLSRPYGTTFAVILANWLRSYDLLEVQQADGPPQLILREKQIPTRIVGE